MTPREESFKRSSSAEGSPVEPLSIVDRYEGPIDNVLRPTTLSEFVGQRELKERLSVVMAAAKKRGEPADHILFAGPPGLGKTSLAAIIATELGVGLRVSSGPAIMRPGDLAQILNDLQPGDVLFIDEIHRLPRQVEELLYVAMEDFKLDMVLGKGPTARSLRIDLPAFTLVGATTRSGMIGGPLRDRFGFVHRLQYYDCEELVLVVQRSARILGIPLSDEAASEIAGRSRGTPRLANRLLKRVRDFVEVGPHDTITTASAKAGLELFGIDELGLDRLDREILEILCVRFPGRAVGLASLADSIREDRDTISDVYEPYLMQIGLLLRTARGRVATPAAYRHLGAPLPIESDGAQRLEIW